MSSAIRKKEIVLLWLGLLAVAALALRPSIRGNDGVGNYVFLASLLRDGDLDFTNDYRAFDALKQYPFHFADLPVDPRTGRPGNRYGVGSALLWSPLVLAVHGGLKAVAPAQATALTRPYEWAVGLATAAWGSLALALIYGRLRRSWRPLPCALTLAGLLLATPLGFYLYAHGSMSHGISFFAVTAALLALERLWARPAPLGHSALLGAASALVLMTRFQDAPWVFLFAAVGAVRLARAWRQGELTLGRVLAVAAAGAIGFLLAFLPQMAVWRVLYGSWLSGPAPYLKASGGAGAFSLWPRHWVQVLIGERGGVLAWHPLYLVGLAGLAGLVRRDGPWRRWAMLGLAGFLLQLWLVSSWSMWWGGASFGNRFFLSALPLLAPGVAALLGARRRGVARLAAGLLALLIVWNLGLLYQYATEMVPREAPAPWSQVIRQNVHDVPRALLDRILARLGR